MKTIARLAVVLALLVVAAPAYSSEVVQMWRCELEDTTTEQDALTAAQDWLNAARELPGGEGMEGYVYFPVVVNGTGEMDMMIVVKTPSFEAWGKFWDAYGGSEAAAIEAQQMQQAVCPDSVLWEAFKLAE